MNFTLCKNRCNYTKRNKQSRNSPLSVQPSQNRTIPPTFRRVSVCVCLYGFASVQNLGHTRLRHPCLACPSRCIDPLHPHNHCKKTIVPCSALNLPPLSKVRCCRPKKFGRLPKGLPPVAPNTAIPTTLLKAHHAFRHTNPFQNRTITIAFRRGVSLCQE